MKPWIGVVAFLVITESIAANAAPDSVSLRARSTELIAPGVYVIRHEDAPDEFPQGNTTVVIGARDVLVVDSCYLPSSAALDIAQIKKWTTKPVRYLLNTHWHYDHTMGNGTYIDAFPGITIIAQRETQKSIRGYNPRWFADFPTRAAQFQKMIDDKHDDKGNALSASDLADLKKAKAGVDPVSVEFRPLAARTDLVPTVVFDRELDLDLGDRPVQLKFLGRGNTAGDAVMYLPREKVIATGDLVDHPVPYLGGGYPVEQIATLDALARLDITTLVPGHGRVLHGTAYVAQEAALIRAVVTEVDAAIYRVGGGDTKLAEVKAEVAKHLDLATLRKQFAGTDTENGEFFDQFAIAGLIAAAYAELWPR